MGYTSGKKGVDFIRGFALKGREPFWGVTASFKHYNSFASLILVAFFINIGALIHVKRIWLKLPLCLLCLLMIFNLCLTNSRGGWLAFFVVNFLLILFYRGKIRIFFVASISLLLLCFIFLPSLRQRLFYLFERGGSADRLRLWLAAFRMFKESPFIGKGLGLFMDSLSLPSLASKLSIDIQYAHNCYLQILAETGIIGFLPFMWFLIEVIRKAYKRIQEKQDFLFMGLFAALIAFLVHMFFDAHLYSLQLSMLFWLIISFVIVGFKTIRNCVDRNVCSIRGPK